MPIMKSTRTLRKEPLGDSTGIKAEAGAKVEILDETNPAWTKIRLLDLPDKPEGFVSADAVDKTATSLGPMDKAAFARECCRHGFMFGVSPHYVMCIAQLRTNITDGPNANGVDIGPLALSPIEWAAFSQLPEFGMNLVPADINSWRLQCLVFALMTRLAQQKLATLLGDQPTPVELYLAQILGAKGAMAAVSNKQLAMSAIVSGISAADVAGEGIDQTRIATRYASLVGTLTAEQAAEKLAVDLQKALDLTRQFIADAGGQLLASAKELLSGAPDGVDAKINLDSPGVPAGRKDMAKLIVTRFAEAGYGVLQQIAALANAIAESALNPSAASPPPEKSFGLFQLNQAGVGAGFPEGVLKDPERNIEIMLAEISKPHQSDAKKRFAGTTSLHEAVSIFVRHFERPADTSGATTKRFAIAQTLVA
jgi:hypothetical protein